MKFSLLKILIICFFLKFSILNVFAHASDADLPNIFWIIAEDASAAHIGAYGENAIQTPNIDRLGQQGILFQNAYVSSPVCSPIRSAMVTGMYPTSTGAMHHRSQNDSGRGRGNEENFHSYHLPDEIPFLPKLMQEAGYYTVMKGWQEGQLGKSDFNFIWDETYYNDHEWLERESTKPLFAQIQLRGGKNRGAEPENPADASQVLLPPYYPSHPVIINDWVRYLNSVMKMDEEVGEILDQIEREGITDNSIVIFITDHGVSHLRSKQYLYEEGIKIPMVMKWPGQIEPGTVRDDMVSVIDLTATILGAAGIDIPPNVQGRDLLHENHNKRDRFYAASDRLDETLDMIRSAQTEKYKYIRNFRYFAPHIKYNRYKFRHEYTKAVLDLHEKGMLNEIQERFFTVPRPVEELYDLEKDPFELYNLADEPGYEHVLVEFRQDLEDWMIRTGDMGLIPEPMLDEYGGKYGSKYAAMRSDELKNQTRHVLEMMDKGLINGRPQRVLSQYLDHEDFSVRYWAATLIAQDQDLSSMLASRLNTLLDDDIHVVRLAAVDALLGIGEIETAHSTLSRELEHDNVMVRHFALLVAENHHEKVHSLENRIKEMVDDPYEYCHRVADRLMHLIQGKDIVGI